MYDFSLVSVSKEAFKFYVDKVEGGRGFSNVYVIICHHNKMSTEREGGFKKPFIFFSKLH